MANKTTNYNGIWNDPIKGLKDLGTILEKNEEPLTRALTDSTQVPIKFANLDIKYGAYILNDFEKYLKFLEKKGLSLQNRAGVGKIASLIPFNMPAWGFTNSLSHAIIFPENSVTINLPSKSQAFNEKLVHLIGTEEPYYLINRDNSPIFSNTSGRDFIKDNIDKTDVIQIYGHPAYFHPSVKEAAWKFNTTLILEGPGNNPGIVCNDADLKAAAKTMADERTMNSGQVCMGLEELFIHEDIYDTFSNLLKKELDQKVVGAAEDPNTDVGPIGKGIANAAANSLYRAVKAGAKIIYEKPDLGVAEKLKNPKIKEFEFPDYEARPGFKKVPIILLEGTNPNMLIMQEEKFSPILPLLKFRSDKEVINTINKNRNYYLATTIYGKKDAHNDLYKFGSKNFGNLFWNRNIFGFETDDYYDVLKDGTGGYKFSRYKLIPNRSNPKYDPEKPDARNFNIKDGKTHWVHDDFSKPAYSRPKRS
ncbi:MAG: aldehyde dehydrogenase [Candidatus Woesearchaeota archaeon]|nr:MAG: aldehyde dehydrogenase [Candidatus Woesearchaeota archaeon]